MPNGPMHIVDAIRHLRDRAGEVDAAPSKSRPHWSLADLDAVRSLVETPAAAEQIALGRIEGLASAIPIPDFREKAIAAIAREALGLPNVRPGAGS